MDGWMDGWVEGRGGRWMKGRREGGDQEERDRGIKGREREGLMEDRRERGMEG